MDAFASFSVWEFIGTVASSTKSIAGESAGVLALIMGVVLFTGMVVVFLGVRAPVSGRMYDDEDDDYPEDEED